MDPADLVPDKLSTCTSCTYADDFSNYWTASIYFKSPENGTYRRVPQMANGQQNGNIMDQDGGATVYYMQPFSGTNMKVTSFKPVRIPRKPTAISPKLTTSKGLPYARGRPNPSREDRPSARYLPSLSHQVPAWKWWRRLAVQRI